MTSEENEYLTKKYTEFYEAVKDKKKMYRIECRLPRGHEYNAPVSAEDPLGWLIKDPEWSVARMIVVNRLAMLIHQDNNIL